MSNEDRAAEYVLGVLTREEREAVKRAAATDPALAEEIESWNEQLSPLLLDAPEVEPPAYLFDRIKAAIAKSGGGDAIITGTGAIEGLPVVVAVFDFSFLGGNGGIDIRICGFERV